MNDNETASWDAAAPTPLSLSAQLGLLQEWVDGFALSFVFSDSASAVRLDADVLYCARHSDANDLVTEALTAAQVAARPVVMMFLGCDVRVMLDALARLNERRSLLEKCGQVVLLVCPVAAKTNVRNSCPDLWHIRTSILSPELPSA